MASKADIVRSFVESVAAGAPKTDLLTEKAEFRALAVNVPGRDAVLARMTAETTGKVYKQVSWEAPHEDSYGGTQIKGTLPAGSPSGGVIPPCCSRATKSPPCSSRIFRARRAPAAHSK